MRKWLVVITWHDDGIEYRTEHQYSASENWRVYPLLLSENCIPAGPHKVEISEVHV